ncbi:cell division protein FtsQ/DivIB [Flocculibacter collagenilyticus]|uniref:cell division protein FtsQ/DivIB n=1 Tax=Flocculibacter collagenilyticus TaxID=2744479 RepID=UPI0018F50695|nr:cell division protein FtsQ/DivIB [Flocculibacter collagenilyticus]
MDKQLPMLLAKSRYLNWSFWLGVMFFVVVLVGLTYVGQKVVFWLGEGGDAPVSEIIIMGERHHTNEEMITQAITPEQFTSLFDLDVNQVQQQVEALPWIYSASIRKQWPGKLHIYVVEQQAVAIWNNDLLLNVNSEVFSAPIAPEQRLLPKLFGPEGSEIDAWREFKGLNALLKINDFEIKELLLSERFAWQVVLSNGIQLQLGQKETVERVQWFIDLYPTISTHNNAQIDVVDLRYDTGLAVKWKSNNEELQKS